MRKILKSLFVVAVVSGAVVLGARAFFSDTETSRGNVLQAGAIDLKIDNTSYYNGEYVGWTSWNLADLDGHLFFNFDDLKPGDWGEDTVSIHVYDNDAYVCADLTLTGNDENGLTEPEEEMGDDSENGELAQELHFVWWADDGDNVYEEGENKISEHRFGDAWLNQSHTVALADSQVNIWDEELEPLSGDMDYYIGKAWCYGDLELSQVVEGDTGPDERNSGVKCNGEWVTNISQTDKVTLDVSFTAVQARNNDNFVCSSDYFGDVHYLKLENKTVEYNPILDDGMYGELRFKSPYPTFDYDLDVYGLEANSDYYLHYFADPWPSSNGKVIAYFTTDGSGEYHDSGSVELDTDLPVAGDANYALGAKLWVIPQSHWDGSQMADWDQTMYLWEWNLVQYDDSDL